MNDEDKMPSVVVRAVMKNGTVIFPNSGVGSPTDDNLEMVMTYI